MEEYKSNQSEGSDAALARRLHEELNGPLTSSEMPSTGVQNPKTKTIECPACTFINTFQDVIPGRSYTCVQCHTSLCEPTRQTNAETAGHKTTLIKCPSCQCLNRIPSGNFDAVVCGGCCRELKKISSTVDVSQPQVPTARKLQVRCGECSSINAVPVDQNALNTRFQCGSCQAINEVVL